MSGKSKRIVIRPKRFTYVDENSRNSSAERSFSSSDDEMDYSYEPPKVRNGLTIRNLMKNSEKFQSGDDHLYTKNGAPENTSTHRESRSTSKTCRETTDSLKNRKRKVSPHCFDESDLQHSKRTKCSSKNAIMARLNRERKKQYIASLENENESLRDENNLIKEKISKQDKIIANLRHEVIYLKSFLANSKEICQLLQNLNKSTGLPVTASILNNPVRKPETKSSPEHGYVSETESDISPPVKAAVKSVKFDLPIKRNDVNLGDYSSKENDAEMFSFDNPFLDDLESPLFPFENEEFFNETINDFDFDLKLPSTDISFDPYLDLNLDSVMQSSEETNLADSNLPSVGICLHVNKKKISVELCPLCCSKANTSTKE